MTPNERIVEMKCWLFRHRWFYKYAEHSRPSLDDTRTCRRCGRCENRCYDMAYGGSIWTKA